MPPDCELNSREKTRSGIFADTMQAVPKAVMSPALRHILFLDKARISTKRLIILILYLTISIIDVIVFSRRDNMDANYNMPSVCPVCSHKLDVTRLTCAHCTAEITGRFKPCRYCALDEKMQLFLEAFIKSGGNIKEVERTLNISYPTVKGLQAELISKLFGEEPRKQTGRYTSGEILDMLENKQISADEAAQMLTGKNTADDFD